MESNERTELTSKIESRLMALGVLGGGGIEQKEKRTHGHGQQCGDWGEDNGHKW